jgi:diguanylate cyclase (GGDEF)-like protein
LEDTNRLVEAKDAPTADPPIDFREQLRRLLPLESLSQGGRSATEGLRSGVIIPIADAGRLALDRIRPLGAAPTPGHLTRAFAPALGAEMQPADVRATTIAPESSPQNPLLPVVGARGVNLHMRAELLPRAQAGLEQVQRLVRFDDPLLYSEPRQGNTRERLIQQLNQAGREALQGSEVRFVPIEEPATAHHVHFDRDLARQALENLEALFYCPDVWSSYSLEAEGRWRGIRSIVVAGVGSRDGAALGVIEVSSPKPDAFSLEDLALVALLADCSAAALERAIRIEKLMFIDPLTSAYNRSYFELQVEKEMARARRDGGSMALCIADIDDFKSFNTRFGYQAGNQVLVHVAQVLRKGVRPFDTVARWGGEEFTVLLTAPVQAQDVLTVSERLRSLVDREPIWIRSLDGRSQRVVVTVSIGVAMFPEHGNDTTELWRATNQALLKAKRPPKNQVVFYGPAKLGSPPGA